MAKQAIAIAAIGFAILSVTLSSFAGTKQQQIEHPETKSFQIIGFILAILTLISLLMGNFYLLYSLIIVIFGLYAYMIFFAPISSD